MVEADGRWTIEHRATGNDYVSPSDDDAPTHADLAYIGRHVDGDRVVLHIAGLHAIGSLGAVAYLASNATELYGEVGESGFSMIVRVEYEGLTITDTEVVSGPHIW